MRFNRRSMLNKDQYRERNSNLKSSINNEYSANFMEQDPFWEDVSYSAGQGNVQLYGTCNNTIMFV
jgi:hypothetical protein